MFRYTNFIVQKVQRTELNMRHSVCCVVPGPQLQRLFCCGVEETRGGYRTQNGVANLLPLEFLLGQTSSSNDYWPGVQIVPSDGIFVNYCP